MAKDIAQYPRLLGWGEDASEPANEVSVAGAPEGTTRLTTMRAWFATDVPSVHVVVTTRADSKRIYASGVAYELAPGASLSEAEAEDALTAAYGPFDPRAAMYLLERAALIRRWTDAEGVRWTQLGDGPVLSERLLRSVAQPLGARNMPSVVLERVAEVMDSHGDRDGLADAVAAELGVSRRTAHRYVKDVRDRRAADEAARTTPAERVGLVRTSVPTPEATRATLDAIRKDYK